LSYKGTYNIFDPSFQDRNYSINSNDYWPSNFGNYKPNVIQADTENYFDWTTNEFVADKNAPWQYYLYGVKTIGFQEQSADIIPESPELGYPISSTIIQPSLTSDAIMPNGNSSPVKKTKVKQPKAANKRKNGGVGANRGGQVVTSVAAPISIGTTVKNRLPNFGANQPFRIQHSEYITDIAGSVAFANSQYSINPGLSLMFPWLNAIANRYEQFRVNSMRFRFVPSCASTATGTVMFGIDYDPADAAPVSKSDLATYKSYISSSPWRPFVNVAVPGDLNTYPHQYVRSGTLASNLDIKTYDVGTLNVATIGQAGTTTIGDLFIDYDITLSKPQTQNVALSGFFNVSSGLAGNALMAGGAVPTGTLSATSSGNIITFRSQFEGICSIVITGTVVTASSQNFLTSTATTTLVEGTCINAAATKGVLTFLVRASPGQTLDISSGYTTCTNAAWRFGNYTYALT